MEDIRAKLKSEHPLPPLPAVAQRLLELINQDAPFEDIATVLATDPAMAARVLRVANSAALRGASPISSLTEAFLRLGTMQLRQLILGLVFVHHFPRRGAFDYVAFWRHSLHVALAAQQLEYNALGLKLVGTEVYTAGLLHDIGIAYLNLTATTRYKEVIVEARASEEPLAAVERRLLGVDHHEAAAYLLGEWRFPPSIVAVCQHHSAPDKARENLRDLVRLVNVADRLVWGQGIDNGAKRVGADFDPLVALPEIRVDPGRYEAILAEIKAKAEQVETSLT
ncbi:MAG TPA: HDOD domain-containing protein [Opitutaceae bacterium]|nr:HDOD domain-containing protein [Opitutaceae bacterium]